MARPKGNVAVAAWNRFAAARRAHFVDGAPRSVLNDAARELNEWAENCDPKMQPDFGQCAELEEYP